MNAVLKAYDDYQQFTTKTAVYPGALAKPYLALGLGDEAGELLEKAMGAKLLRPMADECGDVMWYLAQLLLQYDIKLSDCFGGNSPLKFHADLHSSCSMVAVIASKMQGRVKKEIRDGIDVRAKLIQYANELMRVLDSICVVLATTLLEIIERNKAKLLDRLERNAIKGEGDER